jgi:hypothetical protein
VDVRTGYGQFALSFQEVGILNDEFLCLYHTLSSVFFVTPRSFQVNPAHSIRYQSSAVLARSHSLTLAASVKLWVVG